MTDQHSDPDPKQLRTSREFGRGDRRRLELVQAGMECLAREGWPGLTHRKVAQQASAPVGLVRYHFGNLAGLRSEIARHAGEQLIAPATETLCAAPTMSQLVSTAVALVHESLQDPGGVRLLTHLIVGAAHYEDVAEMIRSAMTRSESRLAEKLLDLDSGWTKNEATAAAGLFIGTLDGVVLHQLVAPTPASTPSPAQLERLFRSALTASPV